MYSFGILFYSNRKIIFWTFWLSKELGQTNLSFFIKLSWLLISIRNSCSPLCRLLQNRKWDKKCYSIFRNENWSIFCKFLSFSLFTTLSLFYYLNVSRESKIKNFQTYLEMQKVHIFSDQKTRSPAAQISYRHHSLKDLQKYFLNIMIFPRKVGKHSIASG